MTGILTQASTGLILAETFESYPNGWAFDAGGTGAVGGLATALAHSGAGAFIVNTKNPFGSGAYAKFTKTVNVQSGANRVARVFRGPPVAACIFDDFPDSSLETTYRWAPQSGSNPTVAAGVATIISGGIAASPRETETNGGLPKQVGVIVARCQYVSDGAYFAAWDQNIDWGDNTLRVEMNRTNADFSAYDDYTNTHLTHLAALDYLWHVWKIDFSKSSVKFYQDGTLLYTDSDSASIPVDQTSYVRSVMLRTSLKCDWIGFILSGLIKASFAIGSSTLFDQDLCTEASAIDNGMFDHGWLAIPGGTTGSQTVELKIRNASSAALVLGNVQHTWDDLVIMLDKNITINGLQGGQKVEVYNAGGGLVGTVTCPAPGSAVTIDVSSLITTAYGFSGYFKVYDTDGTTLLYTGTTVTIWGGDMYTWIPNQSAQAISAVNTLVYRAGSGLSPGTSLVTATLTDLSTGLPVTGKTISFTPNLGTCSPTSGTTDSNGQVQTTFTPGSIAGLGGVQAVFGGDATYAASNSQQLIDIYYMQVAPDLTKDYQVFIAGQEVVFSAGNYTLSSDFKPQPFSVSTPSMNVTVGGWWAVEIYRLGVKEFAGRIMHRKRVSGATPLLTFDGVSEVITLQRRIVNRTYLDDPKNIITDLLTRFPCGITAGAISLFGSNIKIVASYETLYDALIQVQNATGWLFRLNADKTLDFAPTFGTAQAITITEGNQETESTHEEDWSQLDTTVYAIGAGTGASLVAGATNLTTQLLYGLIEEAFPAKNITDSGTLSLRAQALLAQKQNLRETIDVKWIDDYASGSYGPFDTVTVTDADTGLSGIYVIYTLTRDLLDAKLADFSLTNRPLTLADAVQLIRTIVKDLAVA